MEFDLNKIKKSAQEAIEELASPEKLEEIKIKFLGRKSELTELLRSLKDLSIEERRKLGPKLQELKKELERSFDKRLKDLRISHSTLRERIDVTKPGHKITSGHIHPLSKIEEEIEQIFLSMNFSVVEGPEVEDEYHNFDALNIPKDHPAREMWDTFWLRQNEIKNQKSKIKNPEKLLLRTHTSPMQIRYMEKNNPPFQIIVPGRVFRYEATDASHEINFYQVEGLMVGKDMSLANFKFVVEEFFKKFFGSQKIEFRFRPSYFPFVEPGVEVDIKLGKSGKWLEVMGAGMVHRKVFDAVGYNPNDVTGFAFGLGLERLAMIKYKIPDIRLFYSGDLRFIKQF
ncbi:MAG: phenylalanine--tRNA ligase subunit alpha [Candidatus Wolfebacteria bacterium]|nr:phenylalanine--tRNA ligase subunit alpha [Candidatus Wolfebacteria bacterium]